MTKPSVHISFGRDTEFEYPTDLINDIFEYNLSKVHVDTRSVWKPHRSQWDCKSNESVVYSGFKTPSGRIVLVVIAILTNKDNLADFDSHKHYTPEDIDSFLDIAHENKEDFLGV